MFYQFRMYREDQISHKSVAQHYCNGIVHVTRSTCYDAWEPDVPDSELWYYHPRVEICHGQCSLVDPPMASEQPVAASDFSGKRDPRYRQMRRERRLVRELREHWR